MPPISPKTSSCWCGGVRGHTSLLAQPGPGSCVSHGTVPLTSYGVIADASHTNRRSLKQALHALPAPVALADAAERQAVRDALAALPAEQRDALFLAFFQGLSHQEIATCLRTPLGTIKARIRRALLTLRQQLQGEQGH